MKTDDPFSILQEKIVSAGLPIEQAKEYVRFVSEWYSDDLKSGKLKTEDILPSEECLNTLAEAQRIVTGAAMNKMKPRILHPVQIRRFLSVPDIKWKESKEVIAKFFGVTEMMVNAIYASDEAWLQKTSEECLDAALYTNYICKGDSHLSWKVFQYTGLLGREETEKRVNRLYAQLGPDDSTKLIEVDALSGNWLFYMDTCYNPAECISYLIQCKLSTKQITEFVSRYGYVLYLFITSKTRRRIDSIIQNFLYEWQRDYGPFYEGLSQEEIYFLIRGPGKFET